MDDLEKFSRHLWFLFRRCAELSDGDIEYEACPDPCKSNPCPIGHKCVPDPKVCLTLMDRPCQQYQCGKNFFIIFSP